MNHYEALEVNPRASAEVIRAAYKSLMQRYHPDKNPGDQVIAERASRVVQAYEVLSDTEQRARYDLQLAEAAVVGGASKARVLAKKKPLPKKENKTFWVLCLLILIIIAAMWAMTRRLDQQLSSQSAPSDALEKFSAPPATAASALEIPNLITGLTIVLKNLDKPGEDSNHVLNIPVVGVRVGAHDAENAMRHLSNTKEGIAQKLRDKLVAAKFDELKKPDGEKYLTKLMLDIISESAGTAVVTGIGTPTDSADRYGVVAVFLPDSFSVK